MGSDGLTLYQPATFQSVHYGHHDVADDEVGHVAGGHFAALLSVGCGEDVVVVAERFVLQEEDVGVGEVDC